ncbi:type I restriction enzyme, S subunit [Ruminococcaceae bacterium YRB3002]|nr:type I restriction enzyme, S subunit [Ruminococcaceae bacterium YRB3002]
MRQLKNSGIDWVGEIPVDWTVTQIKNAYSFQTGWTPDTHNDAYFSGNNIWVNISDLKQRIVFDSAKHISDEAVEKSSMNISPKGSLMYAFKLSVGAVGFCGVDLYTNEAIATFLNGHNSLEYLYYIAPIFIEKNANENIYGAKLLNQQLIRNAKIILPPLSVQLKIADYLDKKCAHIDSIINDMKAVIVKLKEYKLSVITETVTKGLDPNVDFKDSNVEWLGRVPAHWSLFRVASLYYQTNERGCEDLPILTVSINSGISDRELNDDEQDRVFARSEDRTKYKKVAPGDLAYNMMRAWQGAFGAVRVNGMVSPAYITCRPKAGVDIDTRYIEYLFRSPMAIEEMHRYSYGVADFRLRLYWPEFKNIRLCLPPFGEQTQIADYIDKTSSDIDREITRIQGIVEKLNDYKKSMIYEIVTGKKEVCSLCEK